MAEKMGPPHLLSKAKAETNEQGNEQGMNLEMRFVFLGEEEEAEERKTAG